MEPTSTHSITETLANLSVLWILGIVTSTTLIRLALIRQPGSHARSGAEFLESGLIAVVLVWLLIRPFGIQAYFIPSPSMEPTLMGNNGVGDRILVNKFIYRLHKPQHDDVVVFLAPPNADPSASTENIDFIKRLIGMPGDRIEVVGGRLFANAMLLSHGDVRERLRESGVFGADARSETDPDFLADHHVKFAANGIWADARFIPVSQLAQPLGAPPGSAITVQPGYVLRNGQKLNEPFIAEDPDYDLKIINGQPLKYEYANSSYNYANLEISAMRYTQMNASPTGEIPPRHYLMMGDNRNDSNDGTNWGPLDEARVVGKAMFVFWPLPRMGPITSH